MTLFSSISSMSSSMTSSKSSFASFGNGTRVSSNSIACSVDCDGKGVSSGSDLTGGAKSGGDCGGKGRPNNHGHGHENCHGGKGPGNSC
ncbi:coiled-coil family protein [Dictyostelium discoideum AX4]|uniref:HssA/B-like protein 64 n=1 Tax=Dictyostelium discoideum TaxID=44689 RepID=HSL64_DICDI|nr:coiled-coil family protein [Dictyostelium discoideum AX4]Q54BD9.1 RecName: Full=HssA/B-like protein 64 [Dictyostelium discoideum]EAL60650.1 coiled-coil family protein [Dictyostelium discoideum AX4]|eukprot:XP_629090.1 coiled-coil family protein [Dictyostelium discoideum AX4]